jgi:hypothetical protein
LNQSPPPLSARRAGQAVQIVVAVRLIRPAPNDVTRGRIALRGVRPRPVAVVSHPPWRGTRPTEREARSGQRVGWVEPGARAIAGALVSSKTTSITATLEEVRDSRLRLGLGSVGQGLAKSKKPSLTAQFARQIKHRKRRGRKLANLDEKAVLIQEK